MMSMRLTAFRKGTYTFTRLPIDVKTRDPNKRLKQTVHSLAAGRQLYETPLD